MAWSTGKGWQADKALINEWYNRYLGRNLSDQEWTSNWGPQTKNRGVNFDWENLIANSEEAKAVKNAGGTRAKLESGIKSIDSYYMKYLGRHATTEEAMYHLANTSNPEEYIRNSEEANNVKFHPENIANENNPNYVNPETGIKTETPKEKEDRITTGADALSAKQWPAILAAVKGAASQRGGMDTGGYMTSVGNANAKTWMDAYNAIQNQSNFQSTLDLNTQAQKDAKLAREQGYAVNAATLKAQTPGVWQDILAGVAAGGTVGGGWGALAGGLLGWGKKQGLFG